jgi:methyl-accepting chemotaxis protein
MAGRRSSQTTLRVVLGVFFSTIACVVVYSFFLPLSLGFDAKERIAFWVRMLTVGVLVDVLCTAIVFRMYRPIAGALRAAADPSSCPREGPRSLSALVRSACAAFERIPSFLLGFGACAYVFSGLINLALDIVRRGSVDVGLSVARLSLAAAWGFLNGIVTARLLNIIMIDAKIALGIYDIERVEGARKLKRRTLRGRLLVAGLSIFLFLLAYCGVIFYVRMRGMSALAASGADAAAMAAYGSAALVQGIGIMGGLLAIAVGLYFIVLAEMQAHFDNLLGQVGRMARGDQDLSKRVNVVSFDDIGRMTSGFNRILDSFANTFRGVKTMTNAVYDSSSSIRAASEGAKKTAASLAHLAEEADASERQRVSELGSAVSAFREAAEGIGGSAERTAQEARGIEAAAGGIRAMVESLAASGEEADGAEAAFASLSQAADSGVAGVRKSLDAARAIDEAGSRVSGIARIIADVADRSNLLAMNASIEAAHGGQAGKGFGVVAREMKTLAESVAKSAREIDEEVKAVVETNRRTVQAIEGLGSVFSALSSGIGESGAALRAIASSSRRNAEEAKDDLQLIEKLRSFIGEILESSKAARASVEAMERAVDGLSGSQARSHEVNASLTEGVRSIAGAFDELDESLASALEGVSALEGKVASYKLD